jgi:hypothetical protein
MLSTLTTSTSDILIRSTAWPIASRCLLRREPQRRPRSEAASATAPRASTLRRVVMTSSRLELLGDAIAPRNRLLQAGV